jgi:hypothetical protein
MFESPNRSLWTRIRGKLQGRLAFLRAWPTLLLALRRRRATELWIGDSHAMSFVRHIDNAMFMRAPNGQLVLRVGARLMFSLGQKGFPPRVHRVARLVGRFGRPGAIVPVFSAGEIDVRTQLAERAADFGFVSAYVDACLAVAQTMRAERVGFIVPPPPCDVTPDYAWWPVNGTIAERVAAHTGLRQALAAALTAHPHAVLLDFTPLLADDIGAIPPELTVDSVHTNAAAIAKVREHLALTDPLGTMGTADPLRCRA